jgi:Tfp pilus assembly protein PilF
MNGEAMRTWQVAERVLAQAGAAAGSSVVLQLSSVLNSQGALLEREGRLEEALAKLKQGLHAWEGVMGQRNYDVRIFCRNIAAVLTKMGDAPQAREYLQRAALSNG